MAPLFLDVTCNGAGTSGLSSVQGAVETKATISDCENEIDLGSVTVALQLRPALHHDVARSCRALSVTSARGMGSIVMQQQCRLIQMSYNVNGR